MERGETCTLVDPSWPESWKRKLASVASAHMGKPPAVLVPTSGTTGLPKYCIHTLDTLRSAAKGYAGRFGRRGIIHAVNVLPHHHVGGLMPYFRCLECGGEVCDAAGYRRPESLLAAPFPLGQASISLVPTQLLRMLQDPQSVRVLRSFGLILVGGAACPTALLETARQHGLRLCPCYGSTETAAMISALDPEDFLDGCTGVGTSLPHARIQIGDEQRIRVFSASIALACLPEQENFSREPFLTGDLGTIDENGRLHILGRADRVINTGGEKVHPEQVEAAAMSTGRLLGARCLGVPDPDWGQRVEIEVIPEAGVRFDADLLLKELKERLPSYAIPKAVQVLTAPPDFDFPKTKR